MESHYDRGSYTHKTKLRVIYWLDRLKRIIFDLFTWNVLFVMGLLQCQLDSNVMENEQQLEVVYIAPCLY